MILTDFIERVKYHVEHMPDLRPSLFLVLYFTLLIAGAYMIGRLSILDERRHSAFHITAPAPVVTQASPTPRNIISDAENERTMMQERKTKVTDDSAGAYLASKNGTTFHLPWCSGAKKIKEANRVWFASKEDAIAHGYKPAANCKGI